MGTLFLYSENGFHFKPNQQDEQCESGLQNVNVGKIKVNIARPENFLFEKSLQKKRKTNSYLNGSVP